MLIAHLPAGYILFHTVKKNRLLDEKSKRPLFFGILLGSILPDLDTIWFYALSDRSEVHHSYWTHTPFFWTVLFIFGFVASRFFKNQRLSVFILDVWISAMLHLCLDTIAGQIRWAWPFSNRAIQFVEIPATHSWWVMSFINHWTFLLEIILIVIASIIYFKNRQNKSKL
jgi:inner membrane protein